MNALPSPSRSTPSPLFRGRGAVCGGDDPRRVTEGSVTRLGIRFSGDESRTTHEEVASDVAALPSALPSVLLTDIIGGMPTLAARNSTERPPGADVGRPAGTTSGSIAAIITLPIPRSRAGSSARP